MSTILFALAGMLSVSSAATPPQTINDAFNNWLIESLHAAKAWAPDACLVAAFVHVTPGSDLIDRAPNGRIISTIHYAGGEYYNFFFYAPSVVTDGYHYRSPLQMSEPGETAEDSRAPKKTLAVLSAPLEGAEAKRLPHCIYRMPINLLKAYQTAFPVTQVLGDDEHMDILLNDFSTIQLDLDDRPVTASLTGAGYVWAFAVVGKYSVVKSLSVIDATRGTKIKRKIVQP